MSNNFLIFCDLDGVLADFDYYFEKIVGFSPCTYKNFLCTTLNKRHEPYFWTLIHNLQNFWINLPIIDSGLTLWNFIKKYNPTILTAVPESPIESKRAISQKTQWVHTNLGENILIKFAYLNTHDYTYSNKAQYCTGSSCILLDDSPNNINDWNNAGGIGILCNKTNIKNVIDILRNMGI